jgi:hypothetical protein
MNAEPWSRIREEFFLEQNEIRNKPFWTKNDLKSMLLYTCVLMQVSRREEPASASSRQEQPPQDRPTSTRTAVTCQLQV